MTEDMAFECLLVSQDPSVVSIMDKLLGDLAISTKILPTLPRAVEYLSEDSTDLVIIDWERDSPKLLQHINRFGRPRKPALIVVSDMPTSAPDTYSFLRKPITVESGAQSLKQTYWKLLRDYRQHTRCVLIRPLIARNQDDRSVPITVENIGEGGVGLSAKEFLSLRDVLSFSLLLPGTEMPIDIEVRVLWVRQYGAAGCEFVSISQADRGRLHDWLEKKCPVKKPLVKL
ncbi:MAG: PilZ domain-containing protein [Terriglobales bacterium]|jgi:CheY-like chemotaxis protein